MHTRNGMYIFLEEKIMRIYELPCLDRCKSFYNKAHVIERDDGSKELISYSTKVARIDANNKVYRLWDGYSMTTQRHINSFLNLFGHSELAGKAVWSNVPYCAA